MRLFSKNIITAFAVLIFVIGLVLVFYIRPQLLVRDITQYILAEDIVRMDDYEGILVSIQPEKEGEVQPFLEIGSRPKNFTGEDPIPDPEYRIQFRDSLFEKAIFVSRTVGIESGFLETNFDKVQRGQAYTFRTITEDVEKRGVDYLLYVIENTSEIDNYEVGF